MKLNKTLSDVLGILVLDSPEKLNLWGIYQQATFQSNYARGSLTSVRAQTALLTRHFAN